MTNNPVSSYDDGADFGGVVAGSGVFLVQACALLPGLLPTLLLAGAFVVPLLLPAIPLALLWLVWALARAIARAIGRPLSPGARARGFPGSHLLLRSHRNSAA